MCLNRFGAESEAPLLCFFEFKKKEEKEKEPTIFEVKNMETGKKKKREELSRWNELEMSNSAHFVRLPHLKKKKEMVSPVQFRPPGDSGTLWERRGGM